MAIHHSDWVLHLMYETAAELTAEYQREFDPSRRSDIDLALDFRHPYV